MSTFSYALRDSSTMVRRDMRHTLRNPFSLMGAIVTPVFMLAMFYYVFGGAIESGLKGPNGASGDYLTYLIPGIIMMTAGVGSGWTALNVNSDMTEGIITRFRTMAISRGSVLVGHAIGNLIRTFATVAFVLVVALLMGFQPTAGIIEWIALIGVLALLAFMISWISIPLGLVAKTPAGANVSSLIIQFLLPFLSSAFVSPATMPAGLRWFTDNQPFTPITETMRGLLTGTEIGNNAWIAIAWCVGLTLLGYLWAKSTFNRAAVK
ncbi:ABC transporter permease [Streptomyces sp. NPDC015032]|uniref:ABC transporter permease n=1 Tax=Streptomyces sp. NPDC015032 TaxID=3364937 RepID=UPI00370277D5